MLRKLAHVKNSTVAQAIGHDDGHISRIASGERGVKLPEMEQFFQSLGLRLIGTVPGKASVLSFTLAGYTTDEVGKALNEEGIAVRTGHHCAQPLLEHLGLGPTTRASFALYNTHAEVERLLAGVAHALKVLR